MELFLRRALALAIAGLSGDAGNAGRVFCDRGMINAASGLEALTGAAIVGDALLRGAYHHQVFLAPPWPEIYRTDALRRHDLAEAVGEWERLKKTLPALGCTVILLPKVSVAERADFVLASLGAQAGRT